MRICVCFMDLAYVCARLLRTYTAFACVCVWLLRTLCGSYVRIRLIFCASCADFAYVYGFLCALSGFWFVESLNDSILRVLWFVESLDDLILRVLWFFESLDDLIFDFMRVSMIQSWGFFDLLKVSIIRSLICYLRASCSLWLNCMEDPIFRFLLGYLFDDLYVIIGLSGESDLQGSVKFFIHRSACNLLYDITWSSSYTTIFSWFIFRSYLGSFLLILIEQCIYPRRLILLSTMLLCDSYKCRYKWY